MRARAAALALVAASTLTSACGSSRVHDDPVSQAEAARDCLKSKGFYVADRGMAARRPIGFAVTNMMGWEVVVRVYTTPADARRALAIVNSDFYARAGMTTAEAAHSEYRRENVIWYFGFGVDPPHDVRRQLTSCVDRAAGS